MALTIDRLKGTIKQAYIDAAALEDNEDNVLDIFCQNLATAIINEIKNAEINYISGLTSPSGAVAGAFNGDLT